MKTKLLLAALVVLAGCARPAPDLPPDRSGDAGLPAALLSDFDAEEVAATCGDIRDRRRWIKSQSAEIEREILKTRGDEQAAGYVFGALFPPAVLIIDQKREAKAELDSNQAALDRLILLKRLKGCDSDN